MSHIIFKGILLPVVGAYCAPNVNKGEEKVEKFVLGVALGMAGGALLVANNCKLRNLVKKNQDDLMQKAEQYIDSKLEKMEKKEEPSSN